MQESKYAKVWLPKSFNDVKKEVKKNALDRNQSMAVWILDAIKEKLHNEKGGF